MSSGGERPRSASDTALRADRAALLAVFALLLGLYTLTFSGLPDNPDAEVEFQTVHSLVQHRALSLSDTPEAQAIVAQRFDVAPGGSGREGRWYAWFGLGQALVAVPFYVVGEGFEALFPGIEARHRASFAYGAPRSEYWQHLVVGWRNPLLGAATAALVLLVALRAGASRKSAIAAALLYGTASFAWPQARSTLSDVQASFFLLLAAERWMALSAEAVPRARTSFAGGAAVALAVLTRVALAPAALCVALVFARDLYLRRASARTVAAWLLPIVLGAALFLTANQLRFGSPFESGYGTALAGGTFFSYPPHLGLAGLLLAPGKGLLWMAPLAMLVPLGWWRARTRGERTWPWLVVAVAAGVALPVACTQTWHGAWTYGPRYLLPAVAFAWPAVALAFDALRGMPRARIAGVLLALLGLATSLPGVLVDHMTHQDLAVQAARIAWPDPGGQDERERDAARFLSIQWDWGFAAPWAHWRIAWLRAHTGEDEHTARELFFVDSDARLAPQHERELGWRHVAWVDLHRRLGGPAWAAVLATLPWFLLAAWALRRQRRLSALPDAGPAAAAAQGRAVPPR